MDFAILLVTLGILFLAGLVADQLGNVTRLPCVTMLLLLGVLVGNAGFEPVPDEIASSLATFQ